MRLSMLSLQREVFCDKAWKDSHQAPIFQGKMGAAGSMNRRLSSKLDSGEVPHSPPAHIGRNGGKKGSAVDEGVRQKVRLKFIGAMQRNAALALLNPAEIEGRAAELEEACQSSSSSRCGTLSPNCVFLNFLLCLRICKTEMTLGGNQNIHSPARILSISYFPSC